MDLAIYINLILLCVVNIIFAFSGVVLNTLVIVSFWKSSQLRKKLCHFMIMVLSCFDLISVVTNHSTTLFYLISWLREDYDLLVNSTLYVDFITIFYAYSFFALLVMSLERYLAAYYPIFHRTSVTRRRLLALLSIILIIYSTLYVISTNDMIISRNVVRMIFIFASSPPLLYLNFKLFKISRDLRRTKISPGRRSTVNLTSISACLLVVACLVVLSISVVAFIVFDIISENKLASSVKLSYVWATTTWNMNCTFNSLIFFWKNKVLRTEGMKILKALKDRLFES